MKTDFSFAVLTDGVVQIQDTEGSCATLVIGKTRAILFDTMYGKGDLIAFLLRFTALPLTVINSHGHLDHMGGNFQFDAVYLHPADRSLLSIQLGDIALSDDATKQKLTQCKFCSWAFSETFSQKNIMETRTMPCPANHIQRAFFSLQPVEKLYRDSLFSDLP